MRIARAAASSRRNFSLKNFHQRVTTAAFAFSQPRERSRTCTVVVFLQLVWLFSLSSLQAQDRTIDPPSNQSTEESDSVWKKLGLPEPNPNAPYANPPKLELLFDDDFATDSRSNYKIEGQDNSVGWEPGKLILSDGSKITRELQAENWVELELDLKFPELLQDGQKSELKVLLDLEPANDSYLLLRQKRLDGLTTSEITIYDVPSNTAGIAPPLPTIANRYSINQSLSNGRWRIQFYAGAWRISSHTSKITFHAYVPKQFETISGVSFYQKGRTIEIPEIRACGVPPVDVEFTGQQINQIRDCELGPQQIVALQDSGKFHDAELLAQRTLEIRLQVLGSEHWRIPSDLNRLGHASSLVGRYDIAENCYRLALDKCQRQLPGCHPEIIVYRNNLAGMLCDEMAQPAEAEKMYLETIRMARELLGSNHIDVGYSINGLGFSQLVQGRPLEAEQYYREALQIFQHLFPGDSSEVAGTLQNIAGSLKLQGKISESELFYENALAMLERLHPKGHPLIAIGLHKLASALAILGRNSEAIQMFQDSLKMYRSYVTEGTLDELAILSNLAISLRQSGRDSEAERICLEAISLARRLIPDPQNPYSAKCLSILGTILAKLNRASEAESILEESLSIRRQLYFGDHSEIAESISNLGSIKLLLDRPAEALEQYEEASSMYDRLYAVDHIDAAFVKQNLAICHFLMGNKAEADKYTRVVTESMIQLIDRDSCYLSEEQQMIQANALRWSLDSHIDLAIEYPLAVPFIRSSSWRLKGAVSLRQQQARRAFRSENSTIQLLASKLKDTARQYSMLANAMPEDPTQRDTWLEQLTKLNAERTRFERELSSISSEYQNANDDLQASPENVLAKLPENCVVVDFFRQSTGNPPKYVAIVSHSTLPPVLVPLGIAEEIELLVEQGRSMDWETTTNLDGDESAPLQLRRIIWDRVAEHFGNCTTVLISPDGLLSMVPWSALPGNKPGTYLIEEFSVGILPTPQLLARMLREPSFDPGKVEDPASLLVVGDIDYGADPGASSLPTTMRSAPRTGTEGVGVRDWSELPNAGPEISVIRDLFGDRFPNSKVTRLRRGEATEDRFRTEAEQHSVLHLVTHGYFAPEQLKSIFQLAGNRVDGAVFASDSTRTIGYPPGILSGLVLTGANRVPEIGRDDGILTAIEAQELDLRHVKLVILSACETGLGPVAGAEGLLGMQRSFQLAGAETVVASLWKVPDAETQLLMQEFHRNLWDRKLGKLEALRQAQLAILNSHRQRGGTDEMDSTPSSLPPKFWAAWLLSGDWR